MNEQSLRANDCFDKLLEQYGDMIYRIAYANLSCKADADDVFQNVFLLYFQKNPTFQSEEHRRNWLINVTLKHCKKVQSSSFRRRSVPLEDFPALQTALNTEALDLFQAVRSLPVKYRTPIYLYYYEGFSVEEISTMTGQKPATVRSQMKRGREKLKGALQ